MVYIWTVFGDVQEEMDLVMKVSVYEGLLTPVSVFFFVLLNGQ